MDITNTCDDGMSVEKHIVSFSGGKDSTALLLRMIEDGMRVDEIIFADTGMEFPEMYEHIVKVEDYIGMEITKVKPTHDHLHYMFHHVKTKGKNKGKSGYMWMDFRNRWCTTLLKKQPISKHLKQYKDFQIIEYHGIAFDEKERINKNKDGRNINYPLVDWEMEESDCLKYCYDKGFNWGGLYEKLHRVSCYLCPLQRIGELNIIYTDYPHLWGKMKELDRKNIELYGRQFRKDYSIEDLESKFIRERMKRLGD